MNIRETIKGWFFESEIRQVTQIRESAALQNTRVQERLAELELAIEEQGWRRMGDGADREFSTEGLKQLRALSRTMWLKNPLINRSVNVQALYVWAQGCAVTADNETAQATIDAFIADPGNQAALTGHQARTMKECDLQVLGEIFFVFFDDLSTGAVSVRTLSPDEVTEIKYSPQDAAEPRYYRRVWTQEVFDETTGATRTPSFDEYYPALSYDPPAKPETIGGKKVNWNSPVYHVRVGCLSDMRRGVPETYQGLDWARAYSGFLSDFANVIKAHARFAWQVKTPGGQRNVDALQAALATALNGDAALDTNPPPNVASLFASGTGTELNPIRTAGATTSPESGRQIKLMVASSFGLPETFYGDMNTSNLATAKSLDRPTELKFVDRQALWTSIYQVILGYVLARSKRAANGGMRSVAKPVKITVSFPPILEHDIAETIGAIALAATLDGKAPAGTIDMETIARLVLEALGVQNIDEVLKRIAAEKADREAKAAAIAKQIDTGSAQPPPAQQPPAAAA